MSEHPSQPKTLPPSQNIENCDALMVSLASCRIVIIRRDGPVRICSAERICRPVRQLSPGEPVYYKGRRDVIKSVAVY